MGQTTKDDSTGESRRNKMLASKECELPIPGGLLDTLLKDIDILCRARGVYIILDSCSCCSGIGMTVKGVADPKEETINGWGGKYILGANVIEDLLVPPVTVTTTPDQPQPLQE